MAQTSSWIKQSYSMSVNDLITKICESKSMPDAVSFADSIDNLALSS